MKSIKVILLSFLMLSAMTASAQYTQDNPKVEGMFKIEAGFLHNVGNYGTPTNEPNNTQTQETGYNLNAWEEAAGLNIMGGINISQDFFLGMGAGYNFCAPMRPVHLDKSSHMANIFIDMDFRPVGDTWSPMVGSRLGGSVLLNPNNYGMTISPYIELYGGLNWFYDHALQQMNRNYHSLYIEVGVLFVQQTVFIPIRLGWRL